MDDRALPSPHPDASTAAPARRWGLGHVLVPLGAALSLLPFITTAEALIAGVALALLVGNPYVAFTRKNTHRLLSWGVIGLGAGMDLRVVARAGANGLLYTVLGIATAITLGMLLARLLKVPGVTGLLISVGTAICGGSAIAAVVPVVRAKEQEASVALGTVFLLNSVALLVFPPLGHALGLSEDQFGLWAALAIHDTSSVVGAALQYGKHALEVATTVKLARALWIVPVTLAVGAWYSRRTGEAGKGQAKKPWFILGFVLAAALVTFIPALQPAGHIVSVVAKQALVLTLFLIGVNLVPSALRAVGLRPLVQGFTLWITFGGLSLAAVMLHLIR